MALLVTTENRPVFLPAKIANSLWLVKTGERKGTPEIIEKVMKVNKWYLNRASAPPSYLKAYPEIREDPLNPMKPRGPQQIRLPYKD